MTDDAVHDVARDLRLAFRRLGQSDTYLKRRNARRQMKQLVRRIEATVNREFPPLARSGKVIAQPMGIPLCPQCQSRFRSWKVWGDHVATHRLSESRMRENRQAATLMQTGRIVRRWQCWCGKWMGRLDPHFRRLLAQGEDPRTHLARCELLKAAGHQVGAGAD